MNKPTVLRDLILFRSHNYFFQSYNQIQNKAQDIG